MPARTHVEEAWPSVKSSHKKPSASDCSFWGRAGRSGRNWWRILRSSRAFSRLTRSVLAQGRYRQEALLGRLLRELEDEDSAAIADAVGRAESGRASPAGIADPAAERLALSWRDGLVAGAPRYMWARVRVAHDHRAGGAGTGFA